MDYSRALYKRDYGQKITTDAEGVGIPRAFLAHYHIDAADAVAESDTAVMAATALGASAASVTTGFTNPAVPRNVRIKASAAQVTGASYKVKVHGTNFAGEAISEEINPDGVTASAGNLAFKTITKVDLPSRANTPAKQSGSIQVTAGCGVAGTLEVTVTATTLLGAQSPKVVEVPVTTDLNTATLVAMAIVDALNDDNDISAVFAASVTGAGEDTVTLTAIEYAANDSSLAIAVDPASTGVTVDTYAAGTTGVAEDKISIGWGKKFGIPYMLSADELVILKLFDNAADSGTITNDADELEKNVIALNGTPDGTKPIDLYIIV